ncbi:smad nuclear-interacting protein 1 [Rhexocercosporidium sp. MPI-PUGE-AT-0058]|nr:smad nuclear-interacting protein 1 [Rhexocercosporidium sp. MPI-PUGE-AT-0058]
MDRPSGRDRDREREKERDRREKSRSVSYDSEEERRRRRRREKREKVVGDARGRDDGGESGRDRDRHDGERERERKRRRTRSRSRSPHESSSRRSDRESKHRSTRERSPYRSSSGRDKDREGSATQGQGQVSRKAKGPLPSQASSFQANGGPEIVGAGAVVVAEEKDKQKPNFAATGLLAAASNSVTQADGTAIALKYHEPAEARKPPARDDWKLFVFKGSEILETIDLSLRSCWLVGREVAVVDLPAEHPSVSKQHAVIQFRYIEKKNEFGDKMGRVRPYLIDLDSANGTVLNKEGVPSSRYLELRDKDMIQFGHSTREYVLMLSKS